MNNSTELVFLNDDAGENEGLGDAGIETYKDAIYASIARETGQNSADAWSIKPVKMNFDVIEIDSDKLPCLQKLITTTDRCLVQAKKEKDEKAIDFFTRAKEVLDADKIKILKVADYNTKGLKGPSERGTPFHSLVKGSGISVKESDTSGGSFGIGKNAAFAISELQTVFYASQYRLEDGNLQYIAQGKSVLVSHIDEFGQHKKGKGYWGLPGYKAITDVGDVPEWIRREEQGTSIFSIGFRFVNNWQYKMSASLISNFFCAIHRGDMEFAVNNGEIVINRTTLSMLFDKGEIRRGAEENNNIDGFEFAKSLFTCLTSPYTKEKIFDHPVLGKISFKILVAVGLPKKLALIRNGMVITDSLQHFGDKFARFPMSKEFVAFVEGQDDVGNALIKKMENPRHDELSAERLPDPQKAREANAAMKLLIRMVREAIREETITIHDDEVTVDELTEFFADDSSREKSNDPEHEDNLETFVYEASEKLPKQPHAATVSSFNGRRSTKGRRNNAGGAGGSGSGAGNSNGQNSNSAGEAESNIAGTLGQVFELIISDVRNIFVNDEGKMFRRIFFTSPISCEAILRIQATGINDIEDLTLASSPTAEIKNNMAVLEVEEGQRVFFDIEFAENYNGPIEVTAYTTGGSNEN
jgi:hypothetical protein